MCNWLTSDLFKRPPVSVDLQQCVNVFTRNFPSNLAHAISNDRCCFEGGVTSPTYQVFLFNTKQVTPNQYLAQLATTNPNNLYPYMVQLPSGAIMIISGAVTQFYRCILSTNYITLCRSKTVYLNVLSESRPNWHILLNDHNFAPFLLRPKFVNVSCLPWLF